MNEFQSQLVKPILGRNKSPLLGGKFTNPLHLKSINPYRLNNPPNQNIQNKLKNFNIQLPYVKGLQPNMENNYYSDINSIILEYFGPAASPMSGAAPIGGRTHIIHHSSRVPLLNKVSLGQKTVRQRPPLEKQTPFHNPNATKDGPSPKW